MGSKLGHSFIYIDICESSFTLPGFFVAFTVFSLARWYKANNAPWHYFFTLLTTTTTTTMNEKTCWTFKKPTFHRLGWLGKRLRWRKEHDQSLFFLNQRRTLSSNQLIQILLSRLRFHDKRSRFISNMNNTAIFLPPTPPIIVVILFKNQLSIEKSSQCMMSAKFTSYKLLKGARHNKNFSFRARLSRITYFWRLYVKIGLRIFKAELKYLSGKKLKDELKTLIHYPLSQVSCLVSTKHWFYHFDCSKKPCDVT